MPACSACHTSKVKCDRAESATGICSRCKRLGINCVEHVSKQGQGPRKKRRKGSEKNNNRGENSSSRDGGESLSRSSSIVSMSASLSGGSMQRQNSGFNLLGMAAMRMEDNVLKNANSSVGPNHFGLHILIRQWVSIATLRRSFALLARASTLATKSGISMDDIFANQSPFAKMTNSPPMMFVRESIILPASQQRVSGPRLQFNEIPRELTNAVQLFVDSESAIEDSRWIIVRLIRHGTSRYFLSPGFEKYVATFDEVQTTWEQNLREVKSLWMEESEVVKYSQSFAHQISILKTPSSRCTPCKIPGGTTIYHNSYPNGDLNKRPHRMPIDVEFLMGIKCPDIDTMFLYTEYQAKNPMALQPMQQSAGDRPNSSSVLLGSSQKEEDDFLKMIPDIESTAELGEWWNAIAGPSML